MSIPGIFFYLILLLIWWGLSGLKMKATDGPNDGLDVIMILGCFVGTVAYIIYAIWWLWSHFHNSLPHITIT